jgi:cystathionine gamma-synthase
MQGTYQLPASANQLHMVLFPTDVLPVAKQFWQLTGTGISSRFADHWLSMLPEDTVRTKGSSPPPSFQYLTNRSPGDYSVGPELTEAERCGLNLPLADALSAKHTVRRWIAGALNVYDRQGGSFSDQKNLQVGPNSRGVGDVSENDVYLFPTGTVSAIWDAHRLALDVRPAEKSVCFGSVVLTLAFALPGL